MQANHTNRMKALKSISRSDRVDSSALVLAIGTIIKLVSQAAMETVSFLGLLFHDRNKHRDRRFRRKFAVSEIMRLNYISGAWTRKWVCARTSLRAELLMVFLTVSLFFIFIRRFNYDLSSRISRRTKENTANIMTYRK